MKKISLLLLFIGVLSCTGLKAQDTKAIFGDDVVWYGLDFSNAKFVGQFTNIGDNIANTGYELKKYLLHQVKEIYNTYTFANGKETIDKIINEYEAGDKKEGLGLVFIVESFDKMTNLASVYVTFFDIATKKVLLTEKFVEAPVGVGVRNYWAGAIAKIFKQVGMYKMNEWKSKNK